MKLFRKTTRKVFRHLRKRLEAVRQVAWRLHFGARCAHSQPFSFLFRKLTSRINLRHFIGVQLASATFVASVIIPQVDDISSNIAVTKKTVYTVVVTTIGEAKFQWPMAHFGISQRFSLVHPGMDLTDPNGTPIHPIADGKVVWMKELRWGYGKHILIEHTDGVKSLYSHLSKFDVAEGQPVTKDTELGKVGSTGRSTGNHLHLEIYQDSTPINPLEVLPELTTEK